MTRSRFNSRSKKCLPSVSIRGKVRWRYNHWYKK